MMQLEQTWRWYGPDDPVTLAHIRQAGAQGIVTALHYLPIGAVWEKEEILKRKALVEGEGLRWSVIESLPIHEDIKTQTGNFNQYIEHYKQSLKHIGACGLEVICYNFMPVLDWTRTSLNAPFRDGSTALKFDMAVFAAFDVFILKRPQAEEDYDQALLIKAEAHFQQMTPADREALTATIIAGLPGADQHFGLEAFKKAIEKYAHIDADQYRKHVQHFLDEIIPVARENGIRMAIHPDDPPYNILGLPRIISSSKDVRQFLDLNADVHNGLTLCTGSLGANLENDLPAMVQEFGERIHFVHLRNVSNEGTQTFTEDNHLEGHVDMYQVMKHLLELNRPLPYRPDHGHRMLDDLHKKVNPGYSAIGRLRGLAELRGVEYALLNAKL